MEIIIGQTAGFCAGVKNAVLKTQEILKSNVGKKIYCLGELVHNEQVTISLEDKGLKIIQNIQEVPNSSYVIIRAHGVKKEIYEIANYKEIKLIDLTCPKVLKIHKQARDCNAEGNFIILIGKKDHPEVIGTISFCMPNGFIIEDIDEVYKAIEIIKNSKCKKVSIISQTTFGVQKFENIVNKIKEKLNKDIDLEIHNTICNATNLRQKETNELSQKVDAMIIIGGKNSSNTKKLYDIAKQYKEDVIMAQTKEDIDIKWVSKFKKIGVMAGASTPKESIDGIIEKIKRQGQI